MEFTLVWAALTGVLFLWGAVRLTAPKSDIIEDPFGALLGAATLGLAAGRLAAMVLAGTNPLTHPADILLVRGGVHTGAASLAALVSLAWMGRARPLDGLDALTVPALAGLAGWHLGCIWRSACLGTATELPWAMYAAGSDVGRHPTELYAAMGFLAAAWLVHWASGRSTGTTGLIASLGLAAAGIIRLITEPLRLSLGSGPTAWYLAGSLIGSALAVVLVLASRHDSPRGDGAALTE